MRPNLCPNPCPNPCPNLCPHPCPNLCPHPCPNPCAYALREPQRTSRGRLNLDHDFIKHKSERYSNLFHDLRYVLSKRGVQNFLVQHPHHLKAYVHTPAARRRVLRLSGHGSPIPPCAATPGTWTCCRSSRGWTSSGAK